MAGDIGTVLVVDDSVSDAKTMTKWLRAAGYSAEFVLSGTDALAVVDRAGAVIDVLVIDYLMEPMSGADLIDELVTRGAPPPAIVVSGYALSAVRETCCGLPVVAFVEKDQPDGLVAAVGRAMDLRLADRRERAAHAAVRATAVRVGATGDLSVMARSAIDHLRGR